jgi:hypothetical protein
MHLHYNHCGIGSYTAIFTVMVFTPAKQGHQKGKQEEKTKVFHTFSFLAPAGFMPFCSWKGNQPGDKADSYNQGKYHADFWLSES